MPDPAGSPQPAEPRRTPGRGVAHRRATRKAQQQAAEKLSGAIARTGEQPPQSTADARAEKVRDLLARETRLLPAAKKLREIAPPIVDPKLQKLHHNRARVERAIVNRARLLTHLVPGEPPAPLALPAGTAPAHVRASQLATRYGAHALVLAVVLLVLLSNAFPAFKARAGENGEQEIGDTLDTTELDTFLDVRTEADPADPFANYLSNPGLLHTTISQRTEVYTVQEADTLEALASRFGISPATIMGANNIFDPTLALVPGTSLIILPTDGTYHVVVPGDTLEAVAQLYQVQPQAIAEYKTNGLEPPYTLKPGQALIIPGGTPLPREGFLIHTVLDGESVESLSAMFGLDGQTILDANPELVEGAPLTTGMALRILPVPGVSYIVQPGDTILSIALHFDADPQLIVDYAPNNVKSDADLRPGEFIIVPGGYIVPPTPTPTPTETPLPTATATPTETPIPPTEVRAEPASRGAEPPPPAKPVQPAPKPTPKPAASSGASRVGTGRFIWPVGGVITTYFSKSHNGIDIANKAGTPLRAADSGEVIYASWRTDGLGYAVLIDHHNGYVTVYGHMIRQPAVKVGQLVAKGQTIGYMGSTGKSTGPHVHFIIRSPDRVYMNPLRFLN